MNRRTLKLLGGICAAAGLAGLAGAEPLEVGKAIPKVEAKTHDGKTVKLDEAGAEGWMLVFFYPKAGTPG